MEIELAYKNVALLPMKAHSARVSGKNFRLLGGKPLFRWILDALLEVSEIDAIVINTDAREILVANGLSDGFGNGRVIIRDRKPEICGDFVSMNLVLADDIEAIAADAYLMTHTTNPFLSAASIRAALALYNDTLRDGNGDSLFTVNRVQTRFYEENGTPVNHDVNNLIRTQDLVPWFEENSNLYIFNRESFAKTNARIGVRPVMFETPALESIDIDTPEQWKLAEAVALHGQGVR